MNTKDTPLKPLQGELQSLLDSLDAKYLSKKSDHSLPTCDELDLLTGKIRALGEATGKRRFGPMKMWGVIKAIDRRYKKLGLIDALNKLVDKVVALPTGPLTRIKKKIEKKQETKTDNSAQLELLAGLIEDTRYNGNYADIKWDQLYKTILPFTTDQFRSLAEKSLGGYSFEHALQAQTFYKAFGWAAFVDVQRQHLLWRKNYQEVTTAVVPWLYQLMNPEIHTKLKEVFYKIESGPWTLDEYKRVNEKLSAKTRQQKRRRAKKQIPIP